MRPEWKSELMAYRNEFGIKPEEVKLYGDPWEVASAKSYLEFLELIEVPIKYWMPEDLRGASKFTAICSVPSKTSLDEAIKASKGKFDRNNLNSYKVNLYLNISGNLNQYQIYEVTQCGCGFIKGRIEASQPENQLPWMCKHQIAAIMHLEGNFEEMAKNHGLEGQGIKKRYWTKGGPWWVRNEYDTKDIEIFLKISNDGEGIVRNKEPSSIFKRESWCAYLRARYGAVE